MDIKIKKAIQEYHALLTKSRKEKQFNKRVEMASGLRKILKDNNLVIETTPPFVDIYHGAILVASINPEYGKKNRNLECPLKGFKLVFRKDLDEFTE